MSRDVTSKSWSAADGTLIRTYEGHTGYINACTFIPPTPEHAAGLIATGSLDKNINIYVPDVEFPLAQLTGHEGSVVSLRVAPNGDLLSASWDGTGRVWRGFSLHQTLKGHTKGCWSIAAHPTDGTIITGIYCIVSLLTSLTLYTQPRLI